MSRAFCYQCRRATVSCLCGRIEIQNNQVKVIVLQHPDETGNPKGSAIIAELGLKQYVCWKGEDFTQNEGLIELCRQHVDEVAILYPAENAQPLTKQWLGQSEVNIKYLIMIDATWRKAKKIWSINPLLQTLRCVSLNETHSSNYRIRKVPKPGYLSSLESIVEALRQIEGDTMGYQPMLDLFDEMIDFQIDKMGKDTYQQNYKD